MGGTKILMEIAAGAGPFLDAYTCELCLDMFTEDIMLKCDVCEDFYCEECVLLLVEPDVHETVYRQCDEFEDFRHFLCSHECADAFDSCGGTCARQRHERVEPRNVHVEV